MAKEEELIAQKDKSVYYMNGKYKHVMSTKNMITTNSQISSS